MQVAATITKVYFSLMVRFCHSSTLYSRGRKYLIATPTLFLGLKLFKSSSDVLPECLDFVTCIRLSHKYLIQI
jgi:hypothetical protein